MNKFNFNTPMLDLEGKELPNETLAKSLAGILATETEGKTIKLYDWYKTLQANKEFHLDESDTEDLKKLIEENKRIYIYVKGQLLDVLKNPA